MSSVVSVRLAVTVILSHQSVSFVVACLEAAAGDRRLSPVRSMNSCGVADFCENVYMVY